MCKQIVSGLLDRKHSEPPASPPSQPSQKRALLTELPRLARALPGEHRPWSRLPSRYFNFIGHNGQSGRGHNRMLGELLGVVRQGAPLQNQALLARHEADSTHSPRQQRLDVGFQLIKVIGRRRLGLFVRLTLHRCTVGKRSPATRRTRGQLARTRSAVPSLQVGRETASVVSQLIWLKSVVAAWRTHRT